VLTVSGKQNNHLDATHNDPVFCVSTKKLLAQKGVRICRPATLEEACEPMLHSRGSDTGRNAEAEEEVRGRMPSRDYITTYSTEYVPFAAKTHIRKLFAERTLLPGVVTIVCAYMDHLAALRRVASWIHSLRECTSCHELHEMSDMRRCDRCGHHVCVDDYEDDNDNDHNMCKHCATELENTEEDRRREREAEEAEGDDDDGDDDV
jgi:hypothetical protein